MLRFSCRSRGSTVFIALCLLLFGGSRMARAQKTTLPIAPRTGRHSALVVGCQEYGSSSLQTPRADAAAVAQTLKGLGWEVQVVEDSNSTTLRTALKKWGGTLDKNSVGLFYFSGLGFSQNGTTYVVPTGVSLGSAKALVLAACVSETEIVKTMANAQSRILILNGGRPTAFGGSSVLESLTLAPELPPNTLVAFDSKMGQASNENGTQSLNPYAKLLTTELAKKGAAFVPMFEWIGLMVSTLSDNKQVPEMRHTLTSDFLVAASKNPAPVKPPVVVKSDPKPTPPVVPNANEAGAKWALLIGVEQYQSEDIRPLNFTLRDVAALQKTLPLSGFAPDHILAMTSDLPNKNINYPTNTNILKRLKTLKKQLNEDDTLLIYFSGHGFQEQEGGQNFLGSVNADVTDAALLKKTTVSIEELREALGGLQASQLILIMDCCRNNPFKKDASKGGTDANTRTSSFTKDLSLVSDSVGKKIGTAILFACQEGQRSWEDPDAQQGAFTVFLLEALRGKATRDGTLTVTDLAGYVEKRMKEWCIRTGKDQSPDYEQHNRARIVIQEGPTAVP